MTVSSAAGSCPAHDGATVRTRCASCGRDMCSECWRHDVDGVPHCEPCVGLLQAPLSPLAHVAVTSFLIAMGGLAVRSLPIDSTLRWIVFAFLAAFVSAVTSAPS